MRSSLFATLPLFLLLACSAAEPEATAGTAPAVEAPAAGADPTVATRVEGKAVVGEPAPVFVLPDLKGEAVKLEDLQGQTVVLEWFNPGCPFVKYAWSEDVMPPTVKAALARPDTVWLAINSSAPGKEGHGVDTNTSAAKKWNIEHKILLDETGVVGKAYGAKTTPHMYVIDPKGTLVYNGAIDDAPMGRKGEGAPVNYVNAALSDLGSGQAVGTSQTVPYGCSVKYGS